jgi:tetratricopeptide (TPR) repeat protein
MKQKHWIIVITLAIVAFTVVSAIAFTSRSTLPVALQYPFWASLESRAKTRTTAFEQEIAFYLERIRRNPSDGLDRAALAGLYLKRARVSGEATWYLLAANSAQRSLQALPFLNSDALLVLAEVAVANHDFTEALGLLEQIERITPRSASVLSLQTTIFLARGDIEKAVLTTRELQRGIPTAASLVQLGLLHEASGLDAQADYMAALELEEADDLVGSARIRTFLARWYLRRGKLNLAKDLLLEAGRIVPNEPHAMLLLAETELQMGQLDLAQAKYQILEQRSQKTLTVFNHSALRGMARVGRLRGQDDSTLETQAKDSLRLELKSGALGHARELAVLLLESGQGSDLPEALQLAQQEAKLRTDSETLHVLAWAQLKSGQAQSAKATMKKAMRFGVQDAVLAYRMGQIETALGNSSTAQAWFEKAKEINPNLAKPWMLQVLGLEP